MRGGGQQKTLSHNTMGLNGGWGFLFHDPMGLLPPPRPPLDTETRRFGAMWAPPRSKTDLLLFLFVQLSYISRVTRSFHFQACSSGLHSSRSRGSLMELVHCWHWICALVSNAPIESGSSLHITRITDFISLKGFSFYLFEAIDGFTISTFRNSALKSSQLDNTCNRVATL